MPNEVTFPFESINVTLKDGSAFNLKGPQVGAALQYIPTQGYPPLVKTLKEFMQNVHQPPNWENSELLLTSGSQDGISKSIELCVQEGEPVLVQNPLYTGTEIVVSSMMKFPIIFHHFATARYKTDLCNSHCCNSIARQVHIQLSMDDQLISSLERVQCHIKRNFYVIALFVTMYL